MKKTSVFIGTAAWTIPSAFADFFPKEGSHVERYSQVLNAVEINSSFYKDHQAKTYARWAETTPENFRFSVKLAKQFTHIQRLEVSGSEIQEKLSAINELGKKLGVLLVQLPPSLQFDSETASAFLTELRNLTSVPIAFEPRHETWLSREAKELLRELEISKVLADPPVCSPLNPNHFLNGDLVYFRYHGSPEVYKSPYEMDQLEDLNSDIKEHQKNFSNLWCIFDNTTFGFATRNAVELFQMQRQKMTEKPLELLRSP